MTLGFKNAMTGFRKNPTPPTGGVSGAGSLIAAADSFTVAEDSVLSANVLTNDVSESGGSISVLDFRVRVLGDDPGPTIFTAGQTAVIAGVGSMSITAAGALSFTPIANYNGSVPTTTVFVTDGVSIAASSLSITVTPANDAPVATDDARITLINTPITFNILSTDQDPDGDSISVTLINGSSFTTGVPIAITDGEVVYNGAGSVTVTPDTDFEGQLQFTYTISDGALTDTATVTVLIGAANESMFSAAAPISGVQGNANFNFMLSYRGLYGEAYNNGVGFAIPPFSAQQGLFDLANREPWLYDRASTVYALFLRTQDETILTQALQLADQYFAGVQVSGAGLGTFNIVGGDPGANPADIKYLYPIIAVWYEREKTRLSLSSPSVHRNAAIALYNQSLLSFGRTYNPASAALWTERNAGYAILNCTSAYWLHRSAGNITAANTALADAWAYFTMVEGMSTASGAPLHGHNQHEGSAITTPVSSPWMAAFLAESLVQLYRTDPDERILTWLSNYGQWILDNALYTSAGAELAALSGLPLPAYLAANSATPAQFAEGELLDMEHAPDVAALLRKVIWARGLLSLSVTAFETAVSGLDDVSEVVWNYWTRDTVGYSRYRVNPPRKGGWWFRNAYSDVALLFTEQVPSLPIATATVSVSGSTQSGSLLTATPGTWDGFPSPTLTYQWTRDGVDISGETGTTYTTQVADEGAAVRVREIATNTAGAPTATSNAINVVPAGAPEITVHPSGAVAEVSATAEFSAECDASPTATYQWQVSVDAGATWNNVAEGTGGSGTGNTTTYTTEALAADDNGDRYRCVFTNANGSANTNSATLSMVVDQGSARFTSNDTGGELVFDIGSLGHTDFVIEALMYFEGKSSSASFLGLRHTGNGRYIHLGCNNTFEVYDIGIADSQTGHTAFATQPALNTWHHVTIQCTTIAGGDQLRATFTPAEGVEGTRYAATRANGVEDSVQGQAVFIGGDAIGQPSQSAVRLQYVRARSGNLADAVVDGHRQDIDTSGWAFWWRFYDDSGLAVEDLTGNNRVPTLTGGTFETGPVVPGA